MYDFTFWSIWTSDCVPHIRRSEKAAIYLGALTKEEGNRTFGSVIVGEICISGASLNITVECQTTS